MNIRVCIKRYSVLAAMLGLLATQADAGGTHINKEVGYRISVPDDFEHDTSNPTAIDPFIADNFKGTKPLPTKSGSTFGRHMRTYYFPYQSAEEIARKQKEELEELERNAKEGGTLTFSGLGGPTYQSFEEYAKERIPGFFFDGEKTAKVAGFEATIFEMQFEKLTSIPQRWMACAYKIPGGEFAVVFSCTEQHLKKLKSEFDRAFNSFAMLDKGGLNGPETQRSITLDLGGRVDESDLTPEELIAHRKKMKAEAFQKCQDNLPSDWDTLETKNFLVAYECPVGYAKQVSKQAEGIVGWLDENFASIGANDVQAMIIHVYKDAQSIPPDMNFTFYTKGAVREIKFGKPEDDGRTAEFKVLNTGVIRNWFSQKNEDLWRRLPRWLSWGLQYYVDSAEVKGSRLAFGVAVWEKEQMAAALSAQKDFEGSDPKLAPLRSVKTLLTTPPSEVWDGSHDWYANAQCASLVRYLMEGPGSKSSKTRSIIPDYIGNLFTLVNKIEEDLDREREERMASQQKEGEMSDEDRLKAEDEAYEQRRAQAYDNVAAQLIDDAFELTFTDWNDNDWKVLDSKWLQFAAKQAK